MREVMQETCFSGTSLTLPKSPAKNSGSSQRSSRDLDEPLTENDHDRCSLASFGSGNTTDSDNKVSDSYTVYCQWQRKITVITLNLKIIREERLHLSGYEQSTFPVYITRFCDANIN